MICPFSFSFLISYEAFLKIGLDVSRDCTISKIACIKDINPEIMKNVLSKKGIYAQ